jgi:hypothetical protein
MGCIALFCALAGMAGAADVTGKWDVKATTPSGREHQAEMVLTQEAGKLTGSIAAQSGPVALQDVQLSGDRLSFKIPTGEGAFAIQFTVGEGSLKGTYTAPDGGTGPISAKRPAAGAAGGAGVSGAWKVTAVSGSGREHKLVMNLREEAGKLSGTLETADGNVPLQDVRLAGNELTFKLTADSGSYSVRLTLAEGALKGGYTGGNGESGSVAAVR